MDEKKQNKKKAWSFYYHVSSRTIKKILTGVFENKHKAPAYFCFIAPLECVWTPEWLVTKALAVRRGSDCEHTHRHRRTHKQKRMHTHFVLGLAPLLAGWQYGSITNEGHPGCANRPQSLGRRGRKALSSQELWLWRVDHCSGITEAQTHSHQVGRSSPDRGNLQDRKSLHMHEENQMNFFGIN